MNNILTRVADTVRSYWSGPFASRDPAFAAALGLSGATTTGVAVNSDTAFNSSAFWSAVSIIAGDVASLPLELFKRDKDGSTEPYTDSKLYELVHDSPNPEMTSFVFREALQGHALTWGNAFAEIERNGAGRPAALWPLTPDRVAPFRQDRRVKYRVRNRDQGDTILEAIDTLHVPGLGFDGLLGYSVIEKARDSISMGLAIQRFGGSFFGNGATFGGVLSHPQNLTKEVKQGIRESIDAVHGGVDRAHKFVILGGGMTYTKLGIPPNDAQFLESRRFEIEEIARWFHMPQHKLNGLDHATFSNIVQLNLEYYTSCVRGWLVRWEQEFNRKLISPLERKSQYFKHNPEAILRADPAGRADFYAKQFGIGAISINEIRELENRNSIGTDGDVYFVPANMLPVERLLNPPAPAPLPIVTDVTPPIKALPAKRDEDIEAEELRAALDTARKETGEARAAREAAEDRARIASAKHAKATAHIIAAQAAHADADSKRQVSEGNLEQALAQATAAEAQVAGLVEETHGLSAAVTAAHEARDLAQAEAAEARLQAAERERVAETARHAAEVAAAEALALVAETDARRIVIVEEARQLTEAATAAQEAQRAADDAATAARLAELARERDELHQAAEDKDEALRLQRAAETARLAGMVAAHRALIVDAMSRIIRKETDRARKHQATPDKLRAWADAFYVTHEDVCLDALRPAIRAHLAWQQSTEDVDAVTLGFVREHIADSLRQIQAVAEGSDGGELSGALERMLTQWEQQRPGAFADRILKEEIEYVRTATLQ